ncbi:hypothetical protein F5880DRAFT_1510464 [Lentinula raphanica]|nr:hypothetical protein F5880DRAFT_1510464 [Lentinula raphanica]
MLESGEGDAVDTVQEMKIVYQDFWSRRDRTQITNEYWVEQMDEIVDAYLDFIWRQESGSPTHEVEGPPMLIEVVDVYHLKPFRVRKTRMQSFSKSICDIHGLAFKPHLSTQLSAAFDVYVAILNAVRSRTREHLGHQGREWRMLNMCPPCQYRLHKEDHLDVCMIMTMDGNDSLCHVERKEDVLHNEAVSGSNMQVSRERLDLCKAGGEYFASREETSAWDESNWPTDSQQNPVEPGAASGELYQYPLALLSTYMASEKAQRQKLGEGAPEGKLAVVYGIMCKFSKTVKRSPLNSLAQWSAFLPVIGTMHGYAHERACQLVFLMLYIVGVGLEDGEGCERYFSTSNALAPVTQYQSKFHRHQSISEYAYYHDLQTYANLSKFIYGNYKQALRIISTKHLVRQRMRDAGLTSPDIFYSWLVEEGEYLQNLCRTPPRETLEMEYYIKLEALKDCQTRLSQICLAWVSYKAGARDNTNSLETKHRNEQENERKLIADVQALEEKLEIVSRWLPESEEWISAKTKMARLNVAGTGNIFFYGPALGGRSYVATGYKMRRHISNAIKSRSKSIQAAMKAYNEAAAALVPPCRIIHWDEIVDYTFLSEFDLLCDTRNDVRTKQWASPTNRQIMLEFFKLIRVEEELQRLHIRLYHRECARFNTLHCQRLSAIKKLPGFQLHSLRHFWIGRHISTGVTAMTEVAQDPEDIWVLEEADGGEGEEDELNARWSTMLDAVTTDQ